MASLALLCQKEGENISREILDILDILLILCVGICICVPNSFFRLFFFLHSQVILDLCFGFLCVCVFFLFFYFLVWLSPASSRSLLNVFRFTFVFAKECQRERLLECQGWLNLSQK